MEEMSSTTRKYELYEKKIIEIENDFIHKIDFYILSLDLYIQIFVMHFNIVLYILPQEMKSSMR